MKKRRRDDVQGGFLNAVIQSTSQDDNPGGEGILYGVQ
jgi:hypothetical protein